MGAPLSVLTEHRDDLGRATRLLCNVLDAHGEPRFWSELNDACELLAGLAQMDDGLRDVVIAHISDQFDRVHDLARERTMAREPASFIDGIRVLLDTAGLIGPTGWLATDDLTQLFDALCNVVGRRKYAAEKFLTRLAACYAECDDRLRAGAALRTLTADFEVMEGIEANEMAAHVLVTAGKLLGVALPNVRVRYIPESASAQLAAEGSLFAERRRVAAQRVAAALA